MKAFIFIIVTAVSFSSFATDLTFKTNCALNYEEIRYVENNRVVTSQEIPIVKGQFNSAPPIFYLYAVYRTTTAKFEMNMQDNDNAIAVSFSKDTASESTDLVYLRLTSNDSLDIRIPVQPNEGPTWNPIIRELHLVCKGKPSTVF